MFKKNYKLSERVNIKALRKHDKMELTLKTFAQAEAVLDLLETHNMIIAGAKIIASKGELIKETKIKKRKTNEKDNSISSPDSRADFLSKRYGRRGRGG